MKYKISTDLEDSTPLELKVEEAIKWFYDRNIYGSPRWRDYVIARNMIIQAFNEATEEDLV